MGGDIACEYQEQCRPARGLRGRPALITRGSRPWLHHAAPPGLSHFAFLDGSVHTIEHSLDVATLVMLSAIGDGGDVPDGVFAD
jgi:hypothetical protein